MGRGVRTHAAIFFASALSDADVATLRSSMGTIFAAPAKTNQVILDGDSIQQGEGSLYTQSKMYDMQSALSGAFLRNAGQGGQTLSNLSAYRTSAWLSARFVTGAKNVYGSNAGINDLNGGSTDVQIEGFYQNTLIPAVTGAGYKMVIETLLPFGLSGSKETYRLAVNAWLRSNTALGYILADYGDSGPSGMTYDTTGHPDTAGYAKLAAIAGPVYAAALAS